MLTFGWEFKLLEENTLDDGYNFRSPLLTKVENLLGGILCELISELEVESLELSIFDGKLEALLMFVKVADSCLLGFGDDKFESL